MMRPASYTGGVLDSSANEQSQLHDKIRGVGFLTEAQRKANLAKIVRPFTSSTIAPTAVPSPRRAGSTKSTSSRPLSASGARPASASNSVKKSSASTSSSMHVSATARPTLAGGSSVAARAASIPQPQAPAWIGSGIHEPSRPNAPSQQTPAERAAAHRPPSARATVAQQQPPQPRAAKSHKVVTRRYAKPDATSPRSLDESHAQVSIERHARPLVIRPAAPAAPAGSAKKRAQQRQQAASRWEGPPPAVVKFVPIGHVVGLSRNGEDVTDQVLRASSSGSRYRQQLELAQQQQQDEEDEAEQKYQQSASAPPISAAASLATPYYDGLHGSPQPYSTQFQQQQQQQQPSSSPDSLATEPPSSSPPPPTLSVQTSSATGHDEMPIVAVFSPGGSSTALLASPSPARNGHPQQHGSFGEQSSPPRSGRAAMSNSLLSSPAHRAEQERRRLEMEHEKQMKNYLSPSSRATARKSPAAAKRTTSAGTQFTPNPHRDGRRSDSPRELSQSSSTSSLFYEPRFERPADLPPAPVPHVQPTLLYPPQAADPHRQLAAALRGPAMKYTAASGHAPPEDDTPLSPMHVTLPASEAVESTRSEVSNSLAAVVAERAASRARLQAEEKAKWDEKWSKVKQATQAAAVSAARNLYSPLSSPSSAGAAAAHRAEQQQQQQVAGAHSGATRTLQFEPAIELPSTVVPNLRSPAAAPANAAPPSQPAAVSGGRITDPVVVSHARPQQGGSQHSAATGSNVIFSASSSSSAASSAPVSAAAAPASFPPTRRFVVGSTNPSKLQAVRDVVVRVFGAASGGSTNNSTPALPNTTVHPRSIAAASGLRPAEVVGVSVPSGVSDQPMSARDTLAGSIARAKAALAADPLAEYGVGLEGGAECLEGRWYECGWVAIVDGQGRLGTGSSARFQLADPIVAELLAGHTELAEIVDRLSGLSDVRSGSGFMGMITNDILKRAEAYRHGVLFALAPFISSPVYW